MMYNYEYVSKKEVAQSKNELIEIIHKAQSILRNKDISFQFQFIGSSSRHMITCDRKSNIGYDFDVDLNVFYDEDKYDPSKIKHIMMDAFNSVIRQYGYGYCEDSTRGFTTKKIDRWRSRIIQSCDFAIVNNYTDKNGKIHQQYIRFNKKQHSYGWVSQTKGYYTKPKEEWLKNNGYWDEVLNRYLYKKNHNEGLIKKSRSLYAESLNEIYTKYRIK